LLHDRDFELHSPPDPLLHLTQARETFFRSPFLTCGSNTRVGKIRRCWQEICGAPSAEAFAGFLRALRFQTSALSLADTEAWLRDRCRLAGTRVLRDDWRFPINRYHQQVVTLLARRAAIIVDDH